MDDSSVPPSIELAHEHGSRDVVSAQPVAIGLAEHLMHRAVEGDAVCAILFARDDGRDALEAQADGFRYLAGAQAARAMGLADQIVALCLAKGSLGPRGGVRPCRLP